MHQPTEDRCITRPGDRRYLRGLTGRLKEASNAEMFERARHRGSDQAGFTLIELLTVILIIGVLTAVAVPAFLSQSSRASDSSVEADINSAAATMETYYSDYETYVGATAANLETINSGLTNAFTSTTEQMKVPATSLTANTYAITAVDPHGITFIYTRTSGGTVSRTCTVPYGVNNIGGCNGASTKVSPTSPGTW